MNDKQPYCSFDIVNSFDRLHVYKPVTMTLYIYIYIYIYIYVVDYGDDILMKVMILLMKVRILLMKVMMLESVVKIEFVMERCLWY